MTVLHQQHILLFTVATLFSLIDNSNGGWVVKPEEQREGPSILPVVPDTGDLMKEFEFEQCKNCPKTFNAGSKCVPENYADCICSENYKISESSCFGARCFKPGYWDLDCLVTTMGIGGIDLEGPEEVPEEGGPSIGRPEPGPGLGLNLQECRNCPTTFERGTKCVADKYTDCICSAYDDIDTSCFGARCWDGYWDLDCLVTVTEGSDSEDAGEEGEEESTVDEESSADEVLSLNSSKSPKSSKKSSKESKSAEGSTSTKRSKKSKKSKSSKKSS